ncbi:MAG TPA: hypothetical protein VF570_12390 [Pyrinomonadaceae bacterium]|jgi:hypothetical protein
MSSEAKRTTSPEAVAKQAPTEQQESKPGVPKRFATGQTVCNEKNEKGKLCNGHLKEVNTQHPSRVFLRGDDTLHRCQACGALYMGPPMGHVRDPSKQTRYVERDLAAILRAAGGTLPAYEYPTPKWRGEPKPKLARAKPAPAPARSAAPEGGAAPAADSSPSADAHRPAAEAQAATGQASAAPLSPTAATASPAAGAETLSDLAPEASTELTPGAPRDERPKAETAAPAAPASDAKPKPKKGAGGFKVPPELQPKPGETFAEKVARLKATAEAAKRASGKA